MQQNQHQNIENALDNSLSPPNEVESKSDVYQSPDDVAIQVLLNSVRSKMQRHLDDDHILSSSMGLIEALDLSSKEQKMRRRQESNSFVPRTKEEEEFDEKTNEQIKQITDSLNFSE